MGTLLLPQKNITDYCGNEKMAAPEKSGVAISILPLFCTYVRIRP